MGKKRKKTQTKEKSDEITIDVDSFKEKSTALISKAEEIGKNKYAHYAWIALLVIILIIISSYVRLGTLNLPITENWAEDTIVNNYKGAIEQQIRAERPNLADSSIKKLVDEQYKEYYEANKDTLDSQKKELSTQYKTLLQNENGMTYLLGIDEYHFYDLAKWYQKNGFFGTEIVDGEPRYMLRDGRFGNPSRFQLHPYLIVKLHDFWKPFNPDFNIEWSAFYIQVVLLGLASIPLFFLSKKISGTTGGFIAAALVLTAIPLVGRTMAGSSDDDAHTVIYTFIMLALFLWSLRRKTWIVAVMAALAGLTNAIFMYGWSGWWYGFLLVLGSAGLYVVYEFVRKKIEGKKLSLNDWINNSTFVVVFFVSAIIFAMLLSPLGNASATDRASQIITSPANPMQLVLRLGAGADVSVGAGEYPLWPNVLRTVAELNPASFNQIVRGAGELPLGGNAGIMFFYLSLAGIITLFFRYKENPNYVFYGLILLVWMAGMIFVATSAVRFILMASIPILLGVGALISTITGPLANYVSKNSGIKKSVFVAVVSVLLVLWFLWTPIGNARSASEGNIPIFDEAWYDSVYAMRDHGEERGIVSSWWDYGHFFRAYGEQTVTFDGADQGKRIYWMGRTLLTDDVEEAHNILKVMNCGQEHPYNLLEEHAGTRYGPTQIKLAITQMEREEARAYMKNEDLPDHLIEEVLSLTHCDDLLPMYFVTSEDMVGKASVWSHFGGWNFTKAYFYYYLRHLPLTEVYELAEDDLNLSEEEARALYNRASTLRNENEAAQWISPFISYGTRRKVNCAEENRTVICDYNMVLQQDQTQSVVLRRAVVPLNNLEETQLIMQVVNRATGTPMGQEVLKPSNVVIERNGEFEEHGFTDSGLSLDLVLMDEETRFTSLLTDPALSKSVFTRLFFMEGRGDDLDMFERISDVTSFRGERIIVWKVHP